MSRILVATLSFFSAGIISGFIVGRVTSPDSSNPDTAHRLVAMYAKWTHIDSEHGSLGLRLGNYIYSYSTGDPHVSTKFVSGLEIAESPEPKVNFDQDLEKLTSLAIAAPAGGILVTIAKTMRPSSAMTILSKEHQTVLIAAVVASVGGVALGYYLGHKNKPDYNHPVFQQTVRDTELWRGLEKEWRNEYRAGVLFKIPCARAGPKTASGTQKPGEIRIRPFSSGSYIENEEEKSHLRKVFSLHPEIKDQIDSVIASDEFCRGIAMPDADADIPQS